MLSLYVKVRTVLESLRRDEDGQDLVEYALMVGIIATGLAAILPPIGVKVGAIFTALKTELGA
jgi:Flp pilus assembly pilin Flp